MTSCEITLQGAPPYTVTVGAGALEGLRDVLGVAAAPVALIADKNVFDLYGEQTLQILDAAGRKVIVETFPAGEPNKTRSTKARIEDRLVDEGFGRDGLILALGGGVTIDMAGFIAATYMRGIPFIAVPTTLLAMVDASVGGKTGVNHRCCKNAFGAFHQPRAVVADLDTLKTLPEEELRCGLAEMAKHSLLSSKQQTFKELVMMAPKLIDFDNSSLEHAVLSSIRVKADFVAQDTYDQGIRSVLNLGHTVGHGIEGASRFSISHGHAISIGLAAEVLISSRMGFISRDEAQLVLIGFGMLGLQERLPAGMVAKDVIQATEKDKKRRGGSTRYTLLQEIGRPAQGVEGWTHSVPRDIELSVLEYLE